MIMTLAVGLALALGPLAMPVMAKAEAPAAHHGMTMAEGHCDEQKPPQKTEHHGKADKSCCAASCMAVANLPAPVVAPIAPNGSLERPAPDRFRRGYLAEIATPPPRSA